MATATDSRETKPPTPLAAARVVRHAIRIADIERMRERGALVLEAARERMLEPQPRKRSPTYTGTEVAELCGITRQHLNYLCNKREDCTLPRGVTTGAGGTKRVFTQDEAVRWVTELSRWSKESARPRIARPPGKKGKVIAVANFKGGSSKTTTAFHLAQGLALRHGRRVLLLDLDSQASATVLCDRLPDSEVQDIDTILPFFQGEQPDLRYAVKPTYWTGLSLIPASYQIYELEVQLPILTAEDPEFDFWTLIREGLEPLLDDFDVVVIDTAPSLSYLTFAATYAADGLVIPTPPESLDFASSVMFWKLMTDLYKVVDRRLSRRNQRIEKTYDFVNVLLSKVNSRAGSAPIVTQWIQEAYGDKVLPIAIPLSETTSNKATEFGSVYDISRDDQDPRSVKRVKDMTDEFVATIDRQLCEQWLEEAK